MSEQNIALSKYNTYVFSKSYDYVRIFMRCKTLKDCKISKKYVLDYLKKYNKIPCDIPETILKHCKTCKIIERSVKIFSYTEKKPSMKKLTHNIIMSSSRYLAIVTDNQGYSVFRDFIMSSSASKWIEDIIKYYSFYGYFPIELFSNEKTINSPPISINSNGKYLATFKTLCGIKYSRQFIYENNAKKWYEIVKDYYNLLDELPRIHPIDFNI